MRGEGFAHRGVLSVVGRERLLFPLGALLGAAVVVLPAVASSEASPTVSAVNPGGYYHEWSPASVEVASGGTVTFQNASSTVQHGLVWDTAEAPSCSGIPLGRGETSWKGTCTFSHSGTYNFHCYVHPIEMKGTVTVSANGTTTVTTQGGPPGTTPTGTTTAPGGQEPGGSSGPSGSPLAGPASSAIRLASVQHGGVVRGSVAVSQAGGGSRLEVDLLAKRASLARRASLAKRASLAWRASLPRRASLAGARHAPFVSAGRLVRSSLRPGLVSFKVALNTRATHALRAHHRLALSVRIVIRPVHGSTVTVTRAVLLRS